ncbi:hypothetical protein [Pseudolysinimonas kribbensis]|nr:hypothetical protein [Pseudolysinimonas kribbensis]
MTDDDEHPELAGYEPGSGASLSRPGVRRVLRIGVLIAVAALIIPGIIATVQMQIRTAQAACRIVVRTVDTSAIGAVARFEPAGPAGPSWYCYSRSFDGSELLRATLGLIPGLEPAPRPPHPAVQS